MTIDWETVKDALYTGWNAVTVERPSFIQGDRSNTVGNKVVSIAVRPSTAKRMTISANDRVETHFIIKAYHETKSTLDLYLSEMRRLLNVGVTGGAWRVTGWKLKDSGSLFYYEITGKEVLFNG